MKKSILFLFIFLQGCMIGGLYPPWEMANSGKNDVQQYNPQSLPYIGMTEAELERMWGRGSDSSYYSGVDVKTVWYTRTLLGMLPGYHTGNPFYFNRYLVRIRNGKVEDFSIH